MWQPKQPARLVVATRSFLGGDGVALMALLS